MWGHEWVDGALGEEVLGEAGRADDVFGVEGDFMGGEVEKGVGCGDGDGDVVETEE